MKKYILIALFFFLILQLSKAQTSSFGITANPGLSQITNTFGEFEIKYAFSGNAGLVYEEKLSDKLFLGMEILFVQIEGKEEKTQKLYFGTDITVGGVFVPVSANNISKTERKYHSSYVSLPVYIKCKIWKFGVKAGFQTMLFLAGSYDYKMELIVNDLTHPEEDKGRELGFDRYDYGPKIGLDFILNNKITLRADYYYGISNLTPKATLWERNNRQLTLGLSYIFKQL